MLERFLRNLRYGFRMMRLSPLLTAATLITLALGIGLDAGVFTVINGMLLRPRVEHDPATFAHLYAHYSGNAIRQDYGGQASLSTYRALQSEARSLQQLAAWSVARIYLQDDSSQDLGMYVSCNFFSVYGLQRPLRGRFFQQDECSKPGGPAIAILSEELWARRFHADEELIGKTIQLNQQPFVVVGIAPPNFAGQLRGPGVWVPYTTQPLLGSSVDWWHAEDAPWLWLEGRLQPGRKRTELAAELNVIAAHLGKPENDFHISFDVTSGATIEEPEVRDAARWVVPLVIAGLTLLLLVACANVSVLLLSRSLARRREMAVRIAMGATRSRLLAMLVTENLAVAAAAGVLGLYIALQVPQVLRKLIPGMPYYPFVLDARVFAYLAAITLFAAMLAGMSPAGESLRQDVWESLKGHQAGLEMGRMRWKVRDLLVVAQVSLSMVLMVAAGMFVRAERGIFSADPGLDTRNVMMVPLRLSAGRPPASAAEFYARLVDRLRGVPGVQQVAWSSASPLLSEAEGGSKDKFRLPEQSENMGRATVRRIVSANYFAALGIPLLRGRVFEPGDGETTAVVSQAFAAAFWPGRDPVGQLVLDPEGERLRVVGMVRDARTDRLGSADGPHLYQLQQPIAANNVLLLRFAGESQDLQAAVKNAVRELDPALFAAPMTLRASLDDLAERFRTIADMQVFLAGIAGALSLLGIYGVVSYSVGRRTREFGVRSALGASRGDIMGLVFTGGSRPVVVGMMIGIVLAIGGAIAVSRALQYTPITLVADDPVMYLALCGMMAAAALSAMVGQARRAARVEPLAALRDE